MLVHEPPQKLLSLVVCDAASVVSFSSDDLHPRVMCAHRLLQRHQGAHRGASEQSLTILQRRRRRPLTATLEVGWPHAIWLVYANLA